MLLECLFPTLREEQHVHAEKIKEKIGGFVEGMGDDQARKAFEFCFGHFMDKRHDNFLRLTLAKRICAPLVEK